MCARSKLSQARMLRNSVDGNYGPVAFSDFLDASALKSVGDMMVESGYVPSNSVVRDVFIRPPQVGSGSSSTGTNSNPASPKSSPQLTGLTGGRVSPINATNAETGSPGSPRSESSRGRETLGERNSRVMAAKGMNTPRRNKTTRHHGTRGDDDDEDSGAAVSVSPEDVVPVAFSL